MCSTINLIYDNSEGDSFVTRPLQRTSIEELNNFIKQNQLFLLKKDNETIGCCHIEADGEVLKFGMLSIFPKCRSQGFGKVLMENIESYAQTQGFRKLQLTLLKTLNFIHKHKKFLEDWYTRVGFVFVKEDQFPLVNLLAFPCRYDVYEKDIS